MTARVIVTGCVAKMQSCPNMLCGSWKTPSCRNTVPRVIVDSFARQTVIGVERVHPAKRDLDPPSGRGKTAPLPQMRAPNHDFDENSVVRDMPALYLNFQVGQRPDELLVKPADPVPAFIVLSPRLIIVPSGIAKGSENTFKVMLVFQSNVLLDNCDTRRPRVFVSISRN
jgi:hypothetical protein